MANPFLGGPESVSDRPILLRPSRDYLTMRRLPLSSAASGCLGVDAQYFNKLALTGDARLVPREFLLWERADLEIKGFIEAGSHEVIVRCPRRARTMKSSTASVRDLTMRS